MKPVLILALCGLLIYCAALWPGPQARAQTPQDPSGDGPKLFARHCAVCHGNEGGGDGGAAYLMLPRPRDFTRGEFRLITTDNGVPTNEDLFRVITNGMPGSAMPPWDRLPEEQRRALAAEVKRLWVAGWVRCWSEPVLFPKTCVCRHWPICSMWFISETVRNCRTASRCTSSSISRLSNLTGSSTMPC